MYDADDERAELTAEIERLEARCSASADEEAEFDIVRSFIHRFAYDRFEAAATRVRAKLRKLPAYGLFDAVHRTVWDEFCSYVQEGPIEALETAWNQLIDSLIEEVVNEIPKSDAGLLMFSICWGDGREPLADDPEGPDICPEDLASEVQSALHRLALDRDMSRFK